MTLINKYKQYLIWSILLTIMVSCQREYVVEIEHHSELNLEFLLPDDAPVLPDQFTSNLALSIDGEEPYEEQITVIKGLANRPVEIPSDHSCVISAEMALTNIIYSGTITILPLEMGSMHSARMYLMSSNHGTPLFHIGLPGDTAARSRNVELTIKAPGAYKLALWNDETGDNLIPGDSLNWEEYDTSKSWNLSTGYSMKQVFLKLIYLNGDTVGPFSDSIMPSPFTPSIRLLPASKYTRSNIFKIISNEDQAVDMLVSNNSDSSGISWQSYEDTLDWESTGEGWRKVYVWFSSEFGSVGPIVDSMGIDLTCEVESFQWYNSSGDLPSPGDSITFILTTKDDSCGLETGADVLVTVNAWWSRISLVDQFDGSYVGVYNITPHTYRVEEESVKAVMVDRAGNLSGDVFAENAITGGGYPAGLERTFLMADVVPVEMVWIPPGSDSLGANENEPGSFENEFPLHKVRYLKGFWMAKYEFMQWQWQDLTGRNDSEFQNENRPVERVSWIEVSEMINESNQAEGTDLWRLPSEAEWEYACRAGTSTAFPWGDDFSFNSLPQYGWYNRNSNYQTHDAGTLQPNSWGLYDMHGNLWEWCEDWYHGGYAGAPANGSPWLNPPGEERSIRGGGWFNTGAQLRSARRNHKLPNDISSQIGFRIVRTEP